MNFITITGNLGKDAEKRFLPDGTSVLSFSVADSQGKDKPAIWWDCGLFGKRADSLAQYMRKGQQVTVVGQVSEREYTTKDGVTKKAFSVRVQDVALQGGKRDDEGGGTGYENWARLYCPGAILGVYTLDEMDVKQPRDMGTVRDVSQPADQASNGLLESAENAAADGLASYAAFWKSASDETRKAIGKIEHNRLKALAAAADAARTVDSAQQPVAAFEDVMAAMVSAKDIDALYAAYGLITGSISPEESELLDGKFNELKNALTSEAS